MKILLVNPPNSGRSIPEERYGIDSIKQIFRGEPLALEVLAGNLKDFETAICDLKAAPGTLIAELAAFRPDLVGITGVTCEANTVLDLARQAKESGATTVVGGVHASNDPEFFNRAEVDYVVVGLGRVSFRELAENMAGGKTATPNGVAKTSPGRPLSLVPRRFSAADAGGEPPPAYELVKKHRSHYRLERLGLDMGFVVSAYGCPFDCEFCCISGLTGGNYLTVPVESVVRDIGLLPTPVIRLLDANTFGNPKHAESLCEAISKSGTKKAFLADVRSDTVVKYPGLMKKWQEAGLKAVIIGFEEIDDKRLAGFNKKNQAAINTEAIAILHEIGITIVGDFIINPDYEEDDFARLGHYISDNSIDLPMITVLTPLPGTRLHQGMKDRIIVDDLDFYTLTNAVLPTRLPEEKFYRLYADLMIEGHKNASL